MATDDADDEHREDRGGPDEKRAGDENRAGPEDRPGAPDPTDAGASSADDRTYANAGREPTTQTREGTRNADAGQPAPRRHGPDERGTPQNRRYGSRPPSGRTPPRGADSASGRSRNESPEASGRTPPEEGRGPAEAGRPQADPPDERAPTEGTPPGEAPPGEAPPKRTQPLREPSEPHAETGERVESGGRTEENARSKRGDDADDGEVPKYGGLWDPSWGTGRSEVESDRDRTRRREYERQFDRQRDRQRDFQRDKSGGKYRRR
ncbi:hypothetical protein M0R88_09055 [Halorussus gelatinilyticus]|uniref:Uncharacterized protein n=1 Tax=Halorussus gelatinilyticus TaxID=2937524 RepID=A0A8U0IM76_9EURY|nr:hypothetical protein [Halorussus gelatinilyticus]UPW02227.1 hypothetical protein M0R88_09055 [Halorussus gelatinilyticus]